MRPKQGWKMAFSIRAFAVSNYRIHSFNIYINNYIRNPHPQTTSERWLNSLKLTVGIREVASILIRSAVIVTRSSTIHVLWLRLVATPILRARIPARITTDSILRYQANSDDHFRLIFSHFNLSH